MVSDLQVGIQSFPWMRRQLLQAQGNTLLLVVEVQDYHVDLLVKLDDILRIAYATPAQVRDMYQAVHAAQVDEHTIRSNVLHGALQYLTLLQLGDDLLLLLLQLSLDQSLVADNHVTIFLVDFYYLELHGLAHEDIIVADRLHVNLAARQESLYAKYVYDHATLRAALYVALDDFLVVQRLVYAIPAAACTSLLVAQYQLTLLVLLVLDIHLDGITDFQVRVVAELAHRDYAVTLETDVHDNLALVHRNYGTVHYVVVAYLVHTAGISLLLSLTALLVVAAVFVRIPVETLDRSYILVICHTDVLVFFSGQFLSRLQGHGTGK